MYLKDIPTGNTPFMNRIKEFFIYLSKPESNSDWRHVVFKFFLPFVFAAAGLFIIYSFLFAVTGSDRKFWYLFGFMTVYFLPPLGKETVIPAYLGVLNKLPSGLPHIINPNPFPEVAEVLLISFSITFIDTIVSLFLVWNFDILKKIPGIGHILTTVETKGAKILKDKPWIKRLAFTGDLLFVMFPLQGSGGVGASIIGKAIGLSPYRTVLAVFLGTLIGTLLIGFGTIGALVIVSSFNVIQLILAAIAVCIFITQYILYREYWSEEDVEE